MDDSKEGYLLIGTTMLILLVFLVALLVLMLIYRRRKLEHLREVEVMREKYQKEMLETQVKLQQNIMQEIGREIHDNVGQRLTLAALYTEHLNLESTKEITPDKVGQIAELIHGSLHDLRNLSQNLMHHPDTDMGLTLLLQKEAAKANSAEVCQVRFSSSGKETGVSLKVKNMVLRIVQEFLQNSLKHAYCKNIDMNILFEQRGITFHVSDDGKGFVMEEVVVKDGIGLGNMRIRAELIGASFQLESIPGQGSLLRLFIPADKVI